MSLTSKDIAEICGVSRGTVDRALNDRPGISEEVKKRILNTAEELGYRPHFPARSLVTGSTMTFGVVAFDLRNWFFAELVNAIERHAREAGYFVYLTLTDKKGDIERQCIDHLMDRRVDGLILCSVNHGASFRRYLAKSSVPIVTTANRVAPELSHVGIDDFSAMREAVAYAAARGYRRFVYLSPPLQKRAEANIYAQEQRYQGFLAGIADGSDAGLKAEIIVEKDFAPPLDTLLAGTGTRTAVFCSSDTYALRVLRYCHQRGMRIPDDVGLMGFDGINVLDYVTPKLTTVDYPLDAVGAAAVSLLMDNIAGQRLGESVILPYTIVPGASL